MRPPRGQGAVPRQRLRMTTSSNAPRANAFTPFIPLLFVVLWSTGFIGAKLGLPDCEPLTLLSLRYGAVLLVMGAVVLATRAPWPASRVQCVHIGVSGLLIHAVYLGGVFTAIRLGLPAGVTALVVGLQPVLTALGAGLFLRERSEERRVGKEC